MKSETGSRETLKPETKAERLQRWLAKAGVAFEVRTATDTRDTTTVEVFVPFSEGQGFVMAIFWQRAGGNGRRRSERLGLARLHDRFGGKRELRNIQEVSRVAAIHTGKYQW